MELVFSRVQNYTITDTDTSLALMFHILMTLYILFAGEHSDDPTRF